MRARAPDPAPPPRAQSPSALARSPDQEGRSRVGMSFNSRRQALVGLFVGSFALMMFSHQPIMWSVLVISVGTLTLSDFMFFEDTEFW